MNNNTKEILKGLARKYPNYFEIKEDPDNSSLFQDVFNDLSQRLEINVIHLVIGKQVFLVESKDYRYNFEVREKITFTNTLYIQQINLTDL